jgi:hypothetical protein
MTDRPERQTGPLIAPGANQSARQAEPRFNRAPGKVEIYEIDCAPENETLDAALRTLADAEQVTHGGLTFWRQ